MDAVGLETDEERALDPILLLTTPNIFEKQQNLQENEKENWSGPQI